MLSTESLLAEAVAADRLAGLVIYEPDKMRLTHLAIELRERASALAEGRTWLPENSTILIQP